MTPVKTAKTSKTVKTSKAVGVKPAKSASVETRKAPAASKAAVKKTVAKKPAPPVKESLPVFPFTAILGQEEMKRALLLNAVNPNIRGILALGHRGTAKSTSIRALADLLPRIEMVPECPYHCAPDKPAMLCGACVGAKPGAALPSAFTKAPVTDLPLGATEDRVCGTLDIERALSQGQKAFEPGLLAKANRGFLYIDEVNLLEDHLVDLLLDSAASGVNVVEREGISIVHPAKFTLIGSGNPEEGELRPQLLDRFGLMAEIRTITDLDTRVEIVKRRTEFERDPVAFNQKFEDDQSRLRERVVAARAALDSVEVPESVLRQIAQLCVELEVDGHRGELTLLNASLAQAAFEGHERIEEADVVAVATLALRHRLRKDPLDRTDSGDKIRRAVEKVFAPAAPSQAREAGAHA